MRLLVVVAGASYEEGLRLGLEKEQCPPLITNFANYLWNREPKFDPYITSVVRSSPTTMEIQGVTQKIFDDNPLNESPYLIDEYLRSRGFSDFTHPLKKFLELEKICPKEVNIENYFEYLWNLKTDYISLRRKLLQRSNYNDRLLPTTWEELWTRVLHNAIGVPLSCHIGQSFFNRTEPCALSAGRGMAKYIKKGDVVLNLNYDTLFEMALEQESKRFKYAPLDSRSYSHVLVAKPHGSLNTLRSSTHLHFAQPNIYGALPDQGYTQYTELFPPRSNKTYTQSYYTAQVIKVISTLKPHILTFWGVGFTASDVDLFELYSNFGKNSSTY